MKENKELGNKEWMESFLRMAGRIHKAGMGRLLQDLSAGEAATIEMIGRYMDVCSNESGIFATDLAKCQKTSSPAVSRTLRSLEEKGFIGRKADQNDRRNTYVYLTKEGMKKREEMIIIVDNFSRSVIERMGHEKIKTLIELWREMEEIMQEEINKIGGAK